MIPVPSRDDEACGGCQTMSQVEEKANAGAFWVFGLTGVMGPESEGEIWPDAVVAGPG